MHQRGKSTGRTRQDLTGLTYVTRQAINDSSSLCPAAAKTESELDSLPCLLFILFGELSSQLWHSSKTLLTCTVRWKEREFIAQQQFVLTGMHSVMSWQPGMKTCQACVDRPRWLLIAGKARLWQHAFAWYPWQLDGPYCSTAINCKRGMHGWLSCMLWCISQCESKRACQFLWTEDE